MSKDKSRKRRRWLKSAQRRLVYCLTIGLRLFIFPLPINTGLRLGATLGRLVFYLARSERTKVEKNLELAYGNQLSKKARRDLARKILENAGRGVAELLSLPWWTEKDFRQRIRFVGKENLDEAFSRGKGVLAFSGHFGNWELLGIYLRRIEGYSFGVVARELSNEGLDRLLVSTRQRHGIPVIPRGKTGKALFQHLRKNEGLGMLLDQDTKGESTYVNYFGRPARTQTGPAKLARMTGAPMVPMFIIRNPDLITHTIHVEPSLPWPEADDTDKVIRELTQAYTSVIERYVRLAPDQWMWMHRRWRNQPKQAGNPSGPSPDGAPSAGAGSAGGL
ncbi:MAG: lysophospholipid acyltransferase family protein [bacterium]